MRRLPSRSARLILCLAVAWGSAALAGAAPQDAPAAGADFQVAARPAPLVFFNRTIVVLRARVLGREPADRVDAARRALEDLAAHEITGPIERRRMESGTLVTVASRGVLVLTPLDIDDAYGADALEAASATVADDLRRALAAAIEARRPSVMFRATLRSSAAVFVGVLAIWLLAGVRRAVGRRIEAIAERTVARTGLADADMIRASPLPVAERAVVNALTGVLALATLYATAGFVLRSYPYTQPWGDSMRAFVLATATQLGLGVADAIPGLITVTIIFMLTRAVVRVIGFWFAAVAAGRLTPVWLHPDTAHPTRRLLTGLLWIFATVMAFPYLPGSDTEAFKGVSVFLGLMVTFGSSGLVSQIMSGFTITFSRALRVGDYVRIGDVEGTVMHLGALSTRIETLMRDEVTIPNAVVVSTTTTDYSRIGDAAGIYTPTSVTIGYDTPWRQIHAMMLLAAGRTAGLRADPKPTVLQSGLEDFYVKYTLFVCLERQQLRLTVMSDLHANIQDVFNEYGVQIMSPNYVFDPASPKVVGRADVFAAPAAPGGVSTP